MPRWEGGTSPGSSTFHARQEGRHICRPPHFRAAMPVRQFRQARPNLTPTFFKLCLPGQLGEESRNSPCECTASGAHRICPKKCANCPWRGSGASQPPSTAQLPCHFGWGWKFSMRRFSLPVLIANKIKWKLEVSSLYMSKVDL